MTAKTDVKDLSMTCLESLKHHLIEERLLNIQLSESKIIAQIAVKQLRATGDCGFNGTCLVLIHHLLIEKRSVTFTLSESKIFGPIIGKAALKQLSTTSNYLNTCLALIQHLLIEEGAVTFTWSEKEIIGKAALKQLINIKDYALAKTCLTLIQHFKNGEEEIKILPYAGVIKVVVSFLPALLRDDQVLQTIISVAWNLIAGALDFNINGGKVWNNRLIFIEAEGVPLIQEHLQRFPGKENSITWIVKSLAELVYAWPSKVMCQPIISTFMWILNATTEAQFPVRYWSACALCYLADSYHLRNWPVQQPSHTQVNDAVTEAIANWSLTDESPQEYTSFGMVGEPLYHLAQGPTEVPPCCLHKDAWSLANATMHNGERYCPLLGKHHNYPKNVIRSGTGLEILQAVTASSSFSEETRTLAKTALQQYEDFNKTQ